MPYKEKLIGIYQIRNLINGKVYIGNSNNMRGRFKTHKNLLIKNKHYNSHLQSAWNKYGESNFSFEVIELTKIDNLNVREEFHIINKDSNNREKGYNRRVHSQSNLGIKASLETKEKLRLSHLGYKRSKETQDKISKSQFVRVCQINSNGDLIAVYDSMKEAALKTNISSPNISMCCRKVIKWAKKNYWCYETDFKDFNIDERNSITRKKKKNGKDNA